MSLTSEYIGPDPSGSKITMVRGDTFTRKLFQAADYIDPDDTSLGTEPVDIQGYTYLFEIRETPLEEDTNEPLLSAGNSYFFFGQSDEALQYDIDEGNPTGTTYDELHIEIPDSMTGIEPGTWYYGVRSKQNGTNVVELVVQEKVKVIGDVPRFDEE